MRLRSGLRASLLGLLFLSALSAAAGAQTRDQIRQRDEQLYQQYQDGSPAVAPPDASGVPGVTPYEGAGSDAAAAVPAGGNLTAQLLDRVSALESEVRTLRGRVDELQQQLQTASATLNKQIGDLSFQQQQGATGRPGGTAAGAPPPSPEPATVAPPRIARVPDAAPARLTPEASLRAGNAALGRHDYDGAAADAQAALHGPHAAEAQYLLGAAYAGQRNYQQAAVAYYGAYTKNPRGPMAPSALLHVSASMAAVGQTGAACEALGKLGSEFPQARGGVAASAAALHRRLHC